MSWRPRPLGAADFVLSFLLFFTGLMLLTWGPVKDFGWRDAAFVGTLVLIFLSVAFSLGRARQARQKAPIQPQRPVGLRAFALRWVVFFCGFSLVSSIPIVDNYLVHGINTFSRGFVLKAAAVGVVWAALATRVRFRTSFFARDDNFVPKS